MRSEKEMYDLILDIAKRDERIRAVYNFNQLLTPYAI